MSLVVFPFKVENPEVLIRNLRTAAAHARVQRVLCVGFEEEDTYRSVAAVRDDIRRRTGTPVDLILQQRIGNRRPGKGDAMNTALRYFLEETDLERIHFYDADITSFGGQWITKAEEAADFDYGVVRHYFPRASTDAMITWMITRTGFALLWPTSELSWIEQPLGGELLFKRPVVEQLLADERVLAQSDWGIDTLYTFATVQRGVSIYESYVAQGKSHKVYGRLTDLKRMLVECFAALQRLSHETVPEGDVHRVEYPEEVPQLLAERLAFDLEATIQLLADDWTPRLEACLEPFPDAVREGMLANRRKLHYRFMDADAWFDSFRVLLEYFVPDEEVWEELLFRMWVVRVLNYTLTAALKGYGPALHYLNETIRSYRRRAWSTLPEAASR